MQMNNLEHLSNLTGVQPLMLFKMANNYLRDNDDNSSPEGNEILTLDENNEISEKTLNKTIIPNKSLKDTIDNDYTEIIRNTKKYEKKDSIDVVITGGGMRIYFFALIGIYINEKTNIIYDRISSTSSGVIGALILLFKIDLEKSIKMYNDIHADYKNIYIAEPWKKFFEDNLPDNAHTICNNRLFIQVTEIIPSWPYFKRCVFSTFESKEDLINLTIASCTIPKITYNGFYYPYKGRKFIDGFIPYMFENRDKIVWYFNQQHVSLSIGDTLTARKPDINPLVKEGFEEFKSVIFDNKKSSVFKFIKPSDVGSRGRSIFSLLLFICRLIYNHRRLLFWISAICWLYKKINKINAFTLIYYLDKMGFYFSR
jgi:hypothetical protein